MWKYGLIYAFVTTYDQTIFCKLVIMDNGHHILKYSDCIPHGQLVGKNERERRIISISTRLGLAFLLHKVSDPDSRTWKCNPSTFSHNEWVRTTPVTAEVLGKISERRNERLQKAAGQASENRNGPRQPGPSARDKPANSTFRRR